jgi:hypothetical protein
MTSVQTQRSAAVELECDRRSGTRAPHAGDAIPTWRSIDLIRMDRAFCDAMRREIARGSEQARGPAARSVAARAAHRFDPPPLRSGATSPAELCAEIGDAERFW